MPASGIRAMFSLAEAYDNVISFGLGEPAFATPDNIVGAGCDALRGGYTKYVANAGIMELRKAVAEKVTRDNGIPVTADHIQITFGAGQALMLTMHAILDVGDEVIVPAPYFPNYLGYVHLAGGVPVIVDTYEENQFRVQVEDIRAAITDKTRAVIINSPCNPTGAVLTESDIKEIAQLAKEKNIIVISDEPYETILFDKRKNFSMGALPGMMDQVITINSFSKTYAMTGFRIGYIVAPVEMREQMTLLQESMGSSVTAAVQMAAIEALTGPQDSVTEMAQAYERRRNLLVDGLNRIPGISCIKPGGAFYAFPNIKALGLSSYETAHMLLEKVQVVTTPGSAFGNAGEGYLRLSFAADEESILEGLKRMEQALR